MQEMFSLPHTLPAAQSVIGCYDQGRSNDRGAEVTAIAKSDEILLPNQANTDF
jgi:hypothetical protein